MIFKRYVTTAAIALSLAYAPTLGAQGQEVTRVFRLEHVEPTSMEQTLSLFGARMVSTNDLKTLTVRASPEIMDAIQEVIGRLDVVDVSRAVELTINVLRASDGPSDAELPDELIPVVDQLRSLFSYQSFEVFDTITLRALDGRTGQTSGTVSLPPFSGNIDQPTFYNFSARFDLVSPTPEVTVLRLNQMRAGFRVPVVSGSFDPEGGGAPVRQFQYVDVGVNTDVDVPEGQQVVVGKATVGNSAMVLVMRAEFLD